MAQDLTGEYAIKQGATYRASYVWKTGTTEATATPVNITGYTARCMFKANPVKKASLIQAITKANPCVVTTQDAHKLKADQSVVLPNVGGMVELTGRYTVTVLSPTTFSIGIDSSAYTTYTSGGSVAFLYVIQTVGADGQLVLGTTDGAIQLVITEATTDAMSGGGVYDIELITPITLEVSRPIQGAFEVDLNVTR